MVQSVSTAFVSLNSGARIPQLGLGVWQAGGATKTAVATALGAGYRHVDTAAVYGNEAPVGSAIAESGIPRSEVFVTTKLWNQNHGYDAALRAFDTSLQRLRLDYDRALEALRAQANAENRGVGELASSMVEAANRLNSIRR